MCMGFISTTYDRHRFQGHAFAEWQSDSAWPSFRTWPHSAHCFLNPVEFDAIKIRIVPIYFFVKILNFREQVYRY